MFSECCFLILKFLSRSGVQESSILELKIDRLENFWKLFVRTGLNTTTLHPQSTISTIFDRNSNHIWPQLNLGSLFQPRFNDLKH